MNVAAEAGVQWLLFLPGAEIPAELTGKLTIKLGKPYTVNGIDYPTDSRIFRAASDFVAPANAVALPSTGFTVAPTATPTPTPTPAE